MTNETKALRVTRKNGIALIEMTEPDSRNALSDAMKQALDACVRGLATDTELRAVILTGSDGVFCAGGDLKRMLANHKAGLVHGAEDFAPRMRHLHGWLRMLRELSVPVICAVDGPAYGAGLGLALVGDIVLASDRASFNASFCKVGAVPDGGLFYSLPRMVGLQRAKELFYTGRTVDAEEAQRIGIALEVVPHAQLLERAWQVAGMMCDASRTAFALTKQIASRAMEEDAETLLTFEAQAQAICLSSGYHQEALERFTQKQPPKFNFR
ncbi:enoyl-CoA hydratase/isomerase family protein [Thalassobius vesicularis]|uniref:Enoyl-CoA hydratase/isomerase family protein n=1 Tax=Thalassobius vesicularis TaxID=1294297 RepID=A0A4S3M7Y0_9RHOB|nr:enoyl-CoA hydratase/isomerase family protein [Thalassobius vesicularis]THD71773.1 enoyl-CoA hydratase/isomerase family protein [Thalassobius vesicularis]